MKLPVLFLIFNRPEPTRRSFERIRMAKPPKLFVAADGPRKHIRGEVELCEATRKIVDSVDWDCKLEVLFRSENLGCGIAVSSAISWFFDHVEEGIILEDDCMAHPAFFRYCHKLINDYRDQDEIMMISGVNLLPLEHQDKSKYHMSRFPLVWGWATWKRAWLKFDGQMCKLGNLIRDGSWKDFDDDLDVSYYWMRCFCRCSQINTWDYQWVFSILINRGIVINAGVNLIENIGIGEDSTHTSEGVARPLTTIEIGDFEKLTEPVGSEVDMEFDRLIGEIVMDIHFTSRRNSFLRWRKRLRRRQSTRRLMNSYIHYLDAEAQD